MKITLASILAITLPFALAGCAAEALDDEPIGESAQALTASYDTTLAAPLCSTQASMCDSGTLLVGRAGLGPELHAPNTLRGSCADGSAGTFHVDESLDKLRVYTADGSNLAPGKS